MRWQLLHLAWKYCSKILPHLFTPLESVTQEPYYHVTLHVLYHVVTLDTDTVRHVTWSNNQSKLVQISKPLPINARETVLYRSLQLTRDSVATSDWLPTARDNIRLSDWSSQSEITWQFWAFLLALAERQTGKIRRLNYKLYARLIFIFLHLLKPCDSLQFLTSFYTDLIKGVSKPKNKLVIWPGWIIPGTSSKLTTLYLGYSVEPLEVGT